MIRQGLLATQVEQPPSARTAATNALGDPDALVQTLEVLRFDEDGYRIVGAWSGDTVVRCEPFESLALNLADLWSA